MTNIEMETKIVKPTDENLNKAKAQILNGDIVAIPTETVYGLGANAFDSTAIKKIFAAKGRPQDNPLIVHISDICELKSVASEISDTAKKLAAVFWPGPLTMILPKADAIPNEVSAGLDTVGVRMPSHKVARDFIRLCGVPIAAPSANVSGKPSPTTAFHVYNDLSGKISTIIDGGECSVGLESTVIALGDDTAEILRPGKITIDDLLTVISTVKIDDGVFTKTDDTRQVSSPGMKYRHYSPNANVIMLKGKLTDFFRYVSRHANDKTGVLVFDGEESLFTIPCISYGKKSDSKEQASKLFSALREIDTFGLKTVFARVPAKDGVGMAVYNRLLRACGFDVISLAPAYIIGLTGQTGSGKTTVSEFLEEIDMAVLNCDKISKEIISNKDVMEKLTTYFGDEILLPDKTLNRRTLALRAFENEENHCFLNSVMYPRINKKISISIRELQKKGHSTIVIDAPTLFESGADGICDTIISIIAPKELREERILVRDDLTQEQLQSRINAQHDNDFYTKRSNYIIENDGDLEQLRQKAADIIDTIETKKKACEKSKA